MDGCLKPEPIAGLGAEERKGLAQRGPADALVALALIHHIAISRNVPLPGWWTGS